RQVLQSGAGFNAAGCCILALCDSPQGWLSGWAVLGLGMRLSLYDALFAALAGLLGERSRPLMVQITLLGGLASAVFWPLGHGLSRPVIVLKSMRLIRLMAPHGTVRRAMRWAWR
ncbi:hypothetical protein A234_16691, partial [Pseudomonas syringae pv. actinidiae ICMP 19101]